MGQIITNKYNLPEPLVKAVSKGTYKKRLQKINNKDGIRTKKYDKGYVELYV